jgi:hypothetical protein
MYDHLDDDQNTFAAGTAIIAVLLLALLTVVIFATKQEAESCNFKYSQKVKYPGFYEKCAGRAVGVDQKNLQLQVQLQCWDEDGGFTVTTLTDKCSAFTPSTESTDE